MSCPRRFTLFNVLLYALSFYQFLENERLLLVLAYQDKFLVYLERLPALDMAIQRGRPIKSLSRDKLGQGVLFSFDESKRTLAVCASTKVPHSCCSFCNITDLTRQSSYNSTCSSSMSRSERYKGSEAPSIWLPGIAKDKFRFWECRLLAEVRRSRWWTPALRSESFPSLRCNLGLFLRRFGLPCRADVYW